MISWKKLDTREALQNLIDASHEKPAVIYKHSPQCGVSHFALNRLEKTWDFGEDTLDAYFLDVIAQRDLSDEVSRMFGVRHESPQILVIRNGVSIYDTSHGSVGVRAIKKALNGENTTVDSRGGKTTRRVMLITLIGLVAVVILFLIGNAKAQTRDLGIRGKKAPEWKIDSWVDANGKPTDIRLADYEGKVVYLLCFQSW